MTDYEWDTRCADVELHRLGDGFTTYDFQNFARTLLLGYARVVADIHVETMSLRESAKVELIESTSSRWAGEISVGGASAGIKNPVRYAASEFFGSSPAHGGPPSHSFFKSLGWTTYGYGSSGGRSVDEDFTGPVSSFISRGRRTPHPEGGGL